MQEFEIRHDLEKPVDFKKFIGKTFTSNRCGDFIVLGLHSKSEDSQKRFVCKFINTGYQCVRHSGEIKKGSIDDEIYLTQLRDNRNNSIESVSGEEFSISEYSLDEYDSKITSSNKEEYNKLKIQYEMVAKNLKAAYGKQKVDESSRELINSLYKQEDEIGNKMGELIIKSIKEQSLNTDIFLTLSYSDNNGSLMSFIEHSDILNPITMSKISHH
jgi:hypothetical protein